GAALDVSWSEQKRRLFVANASTMFLERGTKAGVTRALRLAVEPCVDASMYTGCAEGGSRFPVRIVEAFQTRVGPGVLFVDPTDLEGPGSTTTASTWSPSQGSAPLHQQFQRWLAGRYSTIDDLNAAWGTAFTSFADYSLRLPGVRPAGQQGTDWADFLRNGLG